MPRSSAVVSVVALVATLAGASAMAQVAWEPVVGAGASTVDGFGDADNRIVLSSAILVDHIYAGTFNHMFGSEVWRSSNGTSWTRVNSDGFGGTDAALNVGSYSMAEFNGSVFAATWSTGWPSTPSTDTRVWRFESGTTWTQVNADGFGNNNNAEPWAMAEFFSQLYIGVANHPEGAQIWRSHNGVSWVKVSDGGFDDVYNTEVVSMAVFDGYLYAATRNDSTGAEVWRTDTGTSWAQVADPSDFGGADDFAGHAMAAFDGELYLCTFNTVSGGTVYRTSNGTSWSAVAASAGGFGDANNFGSYTMDVYGGILYLGTFNWTTGTEVWATGDGAVWAQVNDDGFGDDDNYSVQMISELDGTLYAGLRNGSGCQIWSLAAGIFADGFELGTTGNWSSP